MRWIVVSLDNSLPAEKRGAVRDVILQVAGINRDDISNRVRIFERLNGMAIERDSLSEKAISTISGVALAKFGGITATSEDGGWYMRLVAAWEQLLDDASNVHGGAVNMSLAPPSIAALPAHPDELIRRATERSWHLGIVPVIAAGNWGRAGDDTMSPWAQSPFCVSVGAANVSGTRVSAFSSRGSINSNSGPMVVAPEEQVPPTGEVGTSFAAPVVTDIAIYLVAFLHTLWTRGGRTIEEFRAVCCRAAVDLIGASARAIEGPPHIRGRGFVDLVTVVQWLQNLSLPNFRSLTPAFAFTSDENYASAKRNAKAFASLVEGGQIGRYTIDEEYDWIKPMFVPGLYPLDRVEGDQVHRGESLVFRQVSEMHSNKGIDWVVTPVGQARFVEITIRPQSQRGTVRRIGAGSGEYRTLEEALAQSQPGDVVWLPKGRYEGPLRLKSGLTIQGEPGTVVTTNSGPAIQGVNIVEAAIREVSASATGNRAPAVDLRGSDDIGFQRCTFESATGNGVNAVMCRRLFFESCHILAGLNGSYFGLGQELRWQSCTVEARQSGIILHGGAGWMHETTITAGADGISYFGFDFPWRFEKEVTVFLYPFSKEILQTRDVRLRSLLTKGPGEWLARLLFGLQIEECSLRAKRAALLANDFHFVTVKGGTRQGDWADLGRINASLTDDMRTGKDPVDLLDMVRQLMSRVELEAVSNEVLNR